MQASHFQQVHENTQRSDTKEPTVMSIATIQLSSLEEGPASFILKQSGQSKKYYIINPIKEAPSSMTKALIGSFPTLMPSFLYLLVKQFSLLSALPYVTGLCRFS